MKCDELKAYNVVATADVNPEVVDSLGCTEWAGYDKADVDAAIAELKAKLEDVQATAYAESVDAGMRERKLKRALWLSRATTLNRIDVGEYLRKHMNSKFWNDGFHTFQEACYVMQNVINNAENACRAKAEEYK